MENKPEKRIVNTFARIGMICGIVSIPTVYVLYLNIIPAILGLIFSSIGLIKAPKLGRTGEAITGLITSVIGLFLFMLICLGTSLKAAGN